MKQQTPINQRESSLCEAMDRFGNFIIGYLTGLSSDPEVAKDLSQRLWVYVYEHFDIENFSASHLLKNKAYWLFLDHYRKQSRSKVEYWEHPPEVEVAPVTQEAGTVAEETALFERFWATFHGLELSEKQKHLFWMKERFGYTVEELATHMGMAPSTAHDWVQRVKKLCLNHLNQSNNDV